MGQIIASGCELIRRSPMERKKLTEPHSLTSKCSRAKVTAICGKHRFTLVDPARDHAL